MDVSPVGESNSESVGSGFFDNEVDLLASWDSLRGDWSVSWKAGRTRLCQKTP